MAKKSDSDSPVRVWAFCVYPESAPENWRELLLNHHVPGVISPLHEFDIEPDGTPKKAHWNVLLQFDGKKSYTQVKKISDELNGAFPIPIDSIRGMTRYFLHVDDPDKYQYDKSGMVGFAGYNWEQYFEYADIERRRALKEMREYIRKYNFIEYSDFCDFCDEYRPEWSELLDKNSSYVISLYITSMRHKLEGERKQ